MNTNLRPMNLGEILDRTFQIYREKFLAFVGIAAAPALAMMGIHFADNSWLHLSSLVRPSDRGGTILWNFVVALFFYHISSLLGLLMLPASTKLASGEILGTNTTILISLRFAGLRWRSYLWVAILKLLAQLVIPEILVTTLLFAVVLIEASVSSVNTEWGFLTFLVLAMMLAGCILFVWLGACLSLSLPICALEGLPGMGALRRSYSLSKGGRSRVILTWLMVFVLALLLALGVWLVSRWLLALLALGHPLSTASQRLHTVAVSLLGAAVSSFVAPIYSIALTLIYYDQRIRHEGYDIERMMDAAGLNAPATPPFGDGPAPSAEAREGQA
jgi:hypothetical protein